jgi:osmotically-inducible protein OsmY
MFGKDNASDKELQKLVNRRLQRSGSQAGIVATVQRGTVTVTGKLRVDDQRLTIVKALRGVNGVRQVIDQLQAPPKKQPQRYQPPISTSSVASTLSGDEDALPQPLLSNQDGVSSRAADSDTDGTLPTAE